MLTSLEIIDSAVKIGLGALIGAFATYFAVRQTQKGESRARRDQRKSALIEQVAVEVESLTDDLANYWVEWNAGVREADGELSAECGQSLAEIGIVIVAKRKEFSSAGARLMLLGLTDSVAALNAYEGLIRVLLDQPLEAELPSIEKVDKVRIYLDSGREAFFAALSKDFISDE